MNEVRIDKFLWAVRLYKTRSLATEECKKNRISIAGVNVKPSRMIQPGDVINVRKPPITYTYRVLDVTENRLGAQLVPNYIEDITPAEQLEILEMNKVSGFVDRAKGLGRPTKKERRELDEFISGN
ncbi:MAG: RNA-binding S4 domain-containing protein [Tannerella sp.]|jgi:ribosome-associated heat shock protein Hsp15|nr:RNA-binding S4 domain-containing protein [Tannerella sp.]